MPGPRRIAAALLALALSAGAAPAAAETTVSLSFDDGSSDQMVAKQLLADHGLHGTFFIITSRVGSSGYLTWDEIASIHADGNEIGGHTINHPDFDTLSVGEQRSEICGARQDLVAHGYPQLSFAYPFGHYDSTGEALVQECGYVSGRASGGLEESPAESIPPLDRWAIRTRNSISGADTVNALETSVLQAETVGGWLNFVFHRICDPGADPACPNFHISASDLDVFLDWLQPREAIGTRVRTIGDVSTSNRQPLFSIQAIRSRRNGAAKLTAYVGRSGLLEVAATAARHKRLIAPVSVQVTHAGLVSVTLRPSKLGKQVLRKRGKLALAAEATFTAFRGTSLSQALKLKLKRRRF